MKAGVKKLNDGDLSRVCGFNGHTGGMGHFDCPDKFEMLRWLLAAGTMSLFRPEHLWVSPAGLFTSTVVRLFFLLRRSMHRYVCKLSWSDHSGNAIQTRTTHTLHTLNIFQQTQAVLS